MQVKPSIFLNLSIASQNMCNHSPIHQLTQRPPLLKPTPEQINRTAAFFMKDRCTQLYPSNSNSNRGNNKNLQKHCAEIQRNIANRFEGYQCYCELYIEQQVTELWLNEHRIRFRYTPHWIHLWIHTEQLTLLLIMILTGIH